MPIKSFPPINVSAVERLPVGISFFGAKWDDHAALKVGSAFEKARTATLPEPSFKRWSPDG